MGPVTNRPPFFFISYHPIFSCQQSRHIFVHRNNDKAESLNVSANERTMNNNFCRLLVGWGCYGNNTVFPSNGVKR